MTERTNNTPLINPIVLTVNGVTVQVPPGATVATAVYMAGAHTRLSVSGEPRAPLCGMGICLECRVSINGVPYQKSCQTLCTPGMQIITCGEPSLP
ncbi:MAG: (2Fe-2S)-binding protein [Acidobacteriaceae bacterium]